MLCHCLSACCPLQCHSWLWTSVSDTRSLTHQQTLNPHVAKVLFAWSGELFTSCEVPKHHPHSPSARNRIALVPQFKDSLLILTANGRALHSSMLSYGDGGSTKGSSSQLRPCCHCHQSCVLREKPDLQTLECSLGWKQRTAIEGPLD